MTSCTCSLVIVVRTNQRIKQGKDESLILYRVAFGCSHKDIRRENTLANGKTQGISGSVC